MDLAAASTLNVPWAAIVPIAIIALAFVGYCLFDVFRSEVRYLPRWAWAVICIVSVPVGGIVYLLIGKDDR